MLKVGGIWVSPVEVENRLMKNPAMYEVAVIGKEDDKGLTKPKAFVVPKDGYQPSKELEKELKQSILYRMAKYK